MTCSGSLGLTALASPLLRAALDVSQWASHDHQNLPTNINVSGRTDVHSWRADGSQGGAGHMGAALEHRAPPGAAQQSAVGLQPPDLLARPGPVDLVAPHGHLKARHEP